MYYRSDVAYLYDGTFEGMLCCIFDSFAKKIYPAAISPQDAPQLTLYPTSFIETDPNIALRVKIGIRKKISHSALILIKDAFFSKLPQKELLILDFVRLGMENGSKTMSMLANDVVAKLRKAALHLSKETEHFKGFVRFSVHGQLLISTIEPKNFVLPYLAPHFSDRFRNFPFIIYDKSHRFALIYKPYEYFIVPMEDFVPPNPDDDELKFRTLWKNFYDSIAIDERVDEKRRMRCMPKRYWLHLTEMNI